MKMCASCFAKYTKYVQSSAYLQPPPAPGSPGFPFSPGRETRDAKKEAIGRGVHQHGGEGAPGDEGQRCQGVGLWMDGRGTPDGNDRGPFEAMVMHATQAPDHSFLDLGNAVGSIGGPQEKHTLTFWPSANSRAAWPQSRTPCCSRTRKPAGRAVAGESYLSSSFIQCAGKGVQKEGVQKSFKKKRALLADGILQLCGHPPRRSRWTPAMGELHFTTKCQNMKVCVGWPLLQPYKKKLSRKPP